jgi:hypothetical protein
VRFGADRFDVEVPRRLQVEQVIVLQQWLEGERDTLDVSQVPQTGAQRRRDTCPPRPRRDTPFGSLSTLL